MKASLFPRPEMPSGCLHSILRHPAPCSQAPAALASSGSLGSSASQPCCAPRLPPEHSPSCPSSKPQVARPLAQAASEGSPGSSWSHLSVCSLLGSYVQPALPVSILMLAPGLSRPTGRSAPRLVSGPGLSCSVDCSGSGRHLAELGPDTGRHAGAITGSHIQGDPQDLRVDEA